ncbi:MAG: class I SAM-dependent methyltransferase [Acidimicrobiales bacterium]|nr:class I SAM-dependent methyltransferase [Acidimicrobiales bacterium]MCB9395938.1 class I SAM-dependent methyltransferase [Acidimicrobiaceae bacterium]
MSPRPLVVDAELSAYIAAHSTPPDAVQHRLIDATRDRTGGAAGMQIGGDQGLLFEMLVRAMGVRRAIEIGTFTGYSALSIARGLPPDGRLLCCDVSEEWTAIAREHWALAGVDDRIDLRIGPALATIAALDPDETFDLAFIDADKTNYGNYFDAIVPRLAEHGLILVDNTLWSRRVLDDTADDRDTQALRAFNDQVARDPRVRCVVLPIGDGVTVLQRRPN